MFPCMNRSTPISTTVRRAARKAGKALRRSAPAAVAILVLASLVGTTLAGLMAQ